MSDIEFHGLHTELTEKILGVFFNVLNELGYGFPESVYHRAMFMALKQAGFDVQEEVPLSVFFRGEKVGTFYSDLLINKSVILELKIAEQITRSHEAQLTHYLRATSVEVGLILAFGERGRFKRIVMTNDRKRGLEYPTDHP